MRRGGLDGSDTRIPAPALLLGKLAGKCCNPLIFLGFSLLPTPGGGSRLNLPGCLTPIACEAGQERLRLVSS